jgi:hypothetical protein
VAAGVHPCDRVLHEAWAAWLGAADDPDARRIAWLRLRSARRHHAAMDRLYAADPAYVRPTPAHEVMS